MYLSRQLYEEALHVQFYLTLLDTYIPDLAGARGRPSPRSGTSPRSQRKADFCFKLDGLRAGLTRSSARDSVRTVGSSCLNLICFASCIEGPVLLRGLRVRVLHALARACFNGLASGTNWVFRDESCHMAFAFEVVKTVREEEPDLFDERMEREVIEMLKDAVDCEMQFAEDLLSGGVAGLSQADMREYLQFVADQRLQNLGIEPYFGSKNPFQFMDLQDVQELSNFFERRVSAYQVSVSGDVAFDEAF